MSLLKANCLVIAMAALSLTDKRYAWIVRPAKLDQQGQGGRDQPEVRVCIMVTRGLC